MDPGHSHRPCGHGVRKLYLTGEQQCPTGEQSGLDFVIVEVEAFG